MVDAKPNSMDCVFFFLMIHDIPAVVMPVNVDINILMGMEVVDESYLFNSYCFCNYYYNNLIFY